MNIDRVYFQTGRLGKLWNQIPKQLMFIRVFPHMCGCFCLFLHFSVILWFFIPTPFFINSCLWMPMHLSLALFYSFILCFCLCLCQYHSVSDDFPHSLWAFFEVLRDETYSTHSLHPSSTMLLFFSVLYYDVSLSLMHWHNKTPNR